MSRGSREYARLFGPGVDVQACGEGRMVYRVAGEDGEAQIVEYDLYPGVLLQFNDVRCRHLHEEGSDWPVLEINYCTAGCFECEFFPGSRIRLQEGGFAACRLATRKLTSVFPTGRYRGISVMLEADAAQRYMDRRHPELALRLCELPNRLCPDNTCFLARADGLLRQSLEQIEGAPPGMGIAYYRVKALELLTLLCAFTPGARACGDYLTQERAELIRHIRDHLDEELDKKMTLEQLAREHGLCVTALKRDFAALCGMSPSAYRRRCRMDQAARLLTQTDEPVLEIAVRVGYLNASKFSAAFQAEHGVTPLAFRKNNRADWSIRA